MYDVLRKDLLTLRGSNLRLYLEVQTFKKRHNSAPESLIRSFTTAYERKTLNVQTNDYLVLSVNPKDDLQNEKEANRIYFSYHNIVFLAMFLEKVAQWFTSSKFESLFVEDEDGSLMVAADMADTQVNLRKINKIESKNSMRAIPEVIIMEEDPEPGVVIISGSTTFEAVLTEEQLFALKYFVSKFNLCMEAGVLLQTGLTHEGAYAPTNRSSKQALAPKRRKT